MRRERVYSRGLWVLGRRTNLQVLNIFSGYTHIEGGKIVRKFVVTKGKNELESSCDAWTKVFPPLFLSLFNWTNFALPWSSSNLGRDQGSWAIKLGTRFCTVLCTRLFGWCIDGSSIFFPIWVRVEQCKWKKDGFFFVYHWSLPPPSLPKWLFVLINFWFGVLRCTLLWFSLLCVVRFGSGEFRLLEVNNYYPRTVHFWNEFYDLLAWSSQIKTDFWNGFHWIFATSIGRILRKRPFLGQSDLDGTLNPFWNCFH